MVEHETNAWKFEKATHDIQQILQIGAKKDTVVLNSFAGSATTAHACIEANKLDGGNRRFILVEMEDYADRLTAERVRRVIDGYEFKGTQKTELLRENLNWRALTNAADLVEKVNEIENSNRDEFDRIRKEVKEGELTVTGEKVIAERTEGLGGTFTYCSLGEPVELDKMLTGETLHPLPALARLCSTWRPTAPLTLPGCARRIFILVQLRASTFG